jgi:predicted amidohydrolase
LILCPTADIQPFAHVPALTVPAQAVIHEFAIACASHCGRESEFAYTGGSRLVSADGTVLAMAGPGPALVIAALLPADPALLSTQARDFRPVE